MKLATYKDGSRDGQLVVVSRDLSQAHYASHIAHRLQQVLDDWNFISPQLQDVFDNLNHGRARHAFAFDPQQCMAPLPRAFGWAQGTAYSTEGLAMTHGASDALAGPHAPMVCASEALGLDFSAQLAVVTGDVPTGCAYDRAIDAVRLLMLVNAPRLVHGAGAALPAAFSPVAVTTDELGDAWARGRVHLPLQTTWNGRKVGLCDAGSDMAHHFGHLIAHLSKGCNVRAGVIVGGGPVSNKGISKGTGARAKVEYPKGYNAITEKRAMETVADGQATTEYMKWGDTIRVDMKDATGLSVFGAIEQEVVPTDIQKGMP